MTIFLDKQHKYRSGNRVLHDYDSLWPEGSKGGVDIHYSPFATSVLAGFRSGNVDGKEGTGMLQPLYTLLFDAVSHHFPTQVTPSATRMVTYEPERAYDTALRIQKIHFSVASILRAGDTPADIAQKLIGYVPDATCSSDYIMAEREVVDGKVVGVKVLATKITTPKDLEGHKIMVAVDPMGATGMTSTGAWLNTYAQEFREQGGLNYFNQQIALHLMITPEYVRHMAKEAPDVQIVALACDRGLSEPSVLETMLGSVDGERGLTDGSYLVPGGGDIGDTLARVKGPVI